MKKQTTNKIINKNNLNLKFKRQKFDGNNLITKLCLPPSVALSRLDRAIELILSEDQLEVRSEIVSFFSFVFFCFVICLIIITLGRI